MSEPQDTHGTVTTDLAPGETVRIGEHITITRKGGKLQITAPKSMKIEKVTAAPIDQRP